MLSTLDSHDRLRTDNERLRAENAELRAKLLEAEETLRALRRGEVDALVVDSASGPQIYTLESAEGASNRLRGEALAHISDAVIATDCDERITFLNAAAERQYGVSANAVLGRPVAAAYRNTWMDTKDEQAAAAALRSHGFWHGEVRHKTTHGDSLMIEASVAVLRDTSASPIGLLSVLRDVTARRQSELALLDAKRALEEANQQLEQKVAERTARLQETVSELESFSYSISHDMRAPLRAIRSFSELLREDCRDSLTANAKDYLHRIFAAAERMDQLIQDVLVYSRVARADLPLGRVELGPFVQRLLESYPQFSNGSAAVEVAMPLAAAHANETALTQCLANLIGNAIKFNAPGRPPEVRIWSETADRRVRLFVRDNGIGIAPQDRETIFGIFNQLDSRRGGTGIGLAIVRKAAERMGGRIIVESTVGVGSTFCLELDAAAPERE